MDREDPFHHATVESPLFPRAGRVIGQRCERLGARRRHEGNNYLPPSSSISSTIRSGLRGVKSGWPERAMGEKPESKTAELDPVLHAVGFEIDVVSLEKINGRLEVTAACCQPFKVMHGGVSALIAEGLASMGAHLASGFQRVAGVQLSINHLKPANMGDLIEAEATPLSKGNRVQVWNVQLWKIDPLTQERSVLISTSTVTLLNSLHIPENARDAAAKLKKYAKL